MKIFFDTEFTGLRKDTTLISIGLVSANGQVFYAEFTDYDKTMVNDWIKENVIKNLMNRNDPNHGYYVGTKEEIRDKLTEWFSQFDAVELVSDVCHYDMVLLIDLFGSAFDLPGNVCPACYDISQDIARKLNMTLTEAFDVSRENLLWELSNQSTEDVLKSLSHNIIDNDTKHNALYDAKIICLLYLYLNK